MTAEHELSKAPEHTEIYPGGATWQIPISSKRQWEAEMERLNCKYNLDYFSDSELYSEPDEGQQYEHGYETLI